MAVRRECYRNNRSSVACKGELFLTSGDLPDLRGSIFTAGNNALAVRREGRRPNRSAVAFKGPEFFCTSGVPKLGRPILADGHNPFAVRGKGCGEDRSNVSADRLQLQVGFSKPIIVFESVLRIP